MRFLSSLALGLASVASAAVIGDREGSADLQTRQSGGLRTVGYYVNWGTYDRNFQPADLVAEQFTHILYSFANLRASGEVYLSDEYADLQKLFPGDTQEPGSNVYGLIKQLFLRKKENRKMKTLLSIGGFTYSPNFPVPASTEQGRKTFADSAVKLVKDLGFDGIDVDWEYPANAQEAADYVALLGATRKALDDYSAATDGYHYLLTVASPAGPSNYEKMDLKGMDAHLDFWNVMAYDFSGSWEAVAGHQANLRKSTTDPSKTPFSADGAVAGHMAAGITADKVVLGMPLYGRSFAETDGIGAPYNGVGEGTWEPGMWDYYDLPQAGAEVTELEQEGASYSYDAAKKFLISYDTPAIATIKAKYIKEKSLGGGMWWDTSSDKTGNESLVGTVVTELGGTAALDQSENQLSFPESIYENLKAGFPN